MRREPRLQAPGMRGFAADAEGLTLNAKSVDHLIRRCLSQRSYSMPREDPDC